jgi:hypothetical protein
MALPSSGTISLNDLQTEFGGSNPIAISEYYRGGGLVPDVAVNANVPTSGQVSLSNFYGASNSDPNPNAFDINNISISGTNFASGNSNQITITGINVPITLTFNTTNASATLNSPSATVGPDVSANIGVYVNGSLANSSGTWNATLPNVPENNQAADVKVTVSNNDTIIVGFECSLNNPEFGDSASASATFAVTNDSSGNALLDTFFVTASVS